MAKAQKGGSLSDFDTDWGGTQDEPVQPVNVFAVQANPHFHVLNLGFVTPPIGDVQRGRKLTVPVRVAARVLIAPGDLRRLAEILSASIRSHEELVQNEREQ